MASATLPCLGELQAPAVIRHLPRCRLFPLTAPTSRLSRPTSIPTTRCFATETRRFVRSPPARVAASPFLAPSRPYAYVTPRPYRARVVVASRVPRCRAAPSRIAFGGRGPSRRVPRASESARAPARPESSCARRRSRAGPQCDWARARVSVPPRQYPGWVRARVSVPPASVPGSATCSCSARQSVPHRGDPARRRRSAPARPAAGFRAPAAAPRLGIVF